MTKRREDPATAMRPFDRTRDGFVLGEGAVFLVLEELSHALSPRSHHLCRDSRPRPLCGKLPPGGPPIPEGYGARRAMEKALRNSAVAPSEVDYINAHGSATKAHDLVETIAIKKVFGEHARRLAVSSTKPVTGHLMGAAGATEAAVCMLSVFHQEIPPTINLHEPAEGCDLDYVPLKSRPYPVRVAINLNSAFGGKNSCLVVARYPGRAPDRPG